MLVWACISEWPPASDEKSRVFPHVPQVVDFITLTRRFSHGISHVFETFFEYFKFFDPHFFRKHNIFERRMKAKVVWWDQRDRDRLTVFSLSVRRSLWRARMIESYWWWWNPSCSWVNWLEHLSTLKNFTTMLKVLKPTNDSFPGSRYWSRYKTSISRNSNVNDFDPCEWINQFFFLNTSATLTFRRIFSIEWVFHSLTKVACCARMNELLENKVLKRLRSKSNICQSISADRAVDADAFFGGSLTDSPENTQWEVRTARTGEDWIKWVKLTAKCHFVADSWWAMRSILHRRCPYCCHSHRGWTTLSSGNLRLSLHRQMHCYYLCQILFVQLILLCWIAKCSVVF